MRLHLIFVYIHYWRLHTLLSHFSQGYMGCCCFRGGNCGESSCPWCCLCMESFFCMSCAVSSNRMFLMDKYRVRCDVMFGDLDAPNCNCATILEWRIMDVTLDSHDLDLFSNPEKWQKWIPVYICLLLSPALCQMLVIFISGVYATF